MALGTDFGGIHSHRDLNLIQQSVLVQPAQPKNVFIDIPGANGFKDFTEWLTGSVAFNARIITWTFALYPGEKWDAMHSEVSGSLNGRYCKITLDTDPEWYYLGRLTVKNYNIDKSLRQITVEATCQPFKLRQTETRKSANISTEYQSFLLNCSRMPVIPSITVTTDALVLWKENTYSINMGTNWIPDIQLQEGENILQVKAIAGSGSVEIVYQEGAL